MLQYVSLLVTYVTHVTICIIVSYLCYSCYNDVSLLVTSVNNKLIGQQHGQASGF